MAPKKKETQKMSLGDFLSDGLPAGGSWADEVEENYGTQQLPSRDTARSGGASMSSWQDRGYSVREFVPSAIPDKPPYTAHLGNLSYDATSESVTGFFDGCDVVSVRIIEDREMMRPKGFGYVEFGNVEGLKKALELDGESFDGRMIKIKVADPPRGGDSRGGGGESNRDLSDWTRRGPLPDLPGRSGGGRQPSDFGGERRAPRDPAAENRAPREMTWERRGPLSPLAQQETGSGSRDNSRAPAEGLGERSDSRRESRRDAPPTWGEGRTEGSRPPRKEYADRPERPERSERPVTAADKDFQWRERMRPDAEAKSPPPESAEAPSSPVAAAPAPAPVGRPRLNLAKRTVSEAPDAASGAGPDAKASPFGAARPIDTAAREKEIEDKKLQVIQERREADEKAKEERRIAKEAAVKAAAEAKEAEEAKPKPEEVAQVDEAAASKENGASTETATPAETKEVKEAAPAPKAKAAEAGNWRSASNEQRVPRGPPGPRGGRGGAPRGGRDGGRDGGRPPRTNGSPGQQPTSPTAGDAEKATPEDDGWTKVPNKKGRPGRP